ncbi:DUF1810 family protein [Bosea sp. (in: a-proteobacteria)]|uniref:DUF1810 family protein n=1 Tax=Bosea sp. (in: a-proteobacteria) TaxID=1871050 RepID=UPI00343E2652
MLSLQESTLSEIFGNPDDLKFSSCMILFALASENQDDLFRKALARYCGGRMNARTQNMLTKRVRSV